MTAEDRARLLLACGAAAGLALAAVGLLRPSDAGSIRSDAVASVNGEPIRRVDYERALGAVAADMRGPIDEERKQQVLGRLVDEELLVQRALDLGFARTDRATRSNLVQAVIGAVVSEADSWEPSDAEVTAFYEQHREYFTTPGRVRIRQVLVRDPEGVARAEEAARRLRAGEPFATVAAELGDTEIAPVPDTPLPAAKLREYLGPTATRTVLELDEGAVSDPVRSSTGFHVLQVVEREDRAIPPLDDVRDLVRAEARRRHADEALRRYLDELRTDADVQVASGLP
jgi:parvulin-like peptidyl-prolyl isomerase